MTADPLSPTSGRLGTSLRQIHDALDVTPLPAPRLDRRPTEQRHPPGGRRAVRLAVAAAATITVLGSVSALAVWRTGDGAVTVGTTGEGSTEPVAGRVALPAAEPANPERPTPLDVVSLPEGWSVLDVPSAPDGLRISASVAERPPLSKGPAPLPAVIDLRAMAESEVVNSDGQGEALVATTLVSPRGTSVTLWTLGGATLPRASFVARWMLPSGAIVEARGRHQVTTEQFLTVVDGVREG